jgi:hypothetical protein
MINYDEIKQAVDEYKNALRRLHSLGVLKNQKDFTSQIGEWFVESLYEGKRAVSGKQQYWDIITESNLKIQVKSHAKAATTKARFTSAKKLLHPGYDLLILVVFDSEYCIKELYKVPFSVVTQRCKQEKSDTVIYWDSLIEFKVNLSELENQKLISIFK